MELKRKPKKVQPSRKRAIYIKCKECSGADGLVDCEIVQCPLYFWQPYRKKEPDLSWVNKKFR